jgi:MFS family permease
MASYGYVASLPLIIVMVIPHGILEAVQSPGTQAAVADAAPRRDTAAAQGLAEAAGSAAAAVGAFTAAPLFASLGAGPAWLIAGVVMASLLGTSGWLDRPRLPATTPAPVPPGAGVPLTE